MTSPTHYIDSTASLKQLVAELAGVTSVALDTEFVWERTYFPQLGLVQLATADGMTALIDTVAVPDLAPLGPLLASPDCVKILHDAQQDLTILRRASGVFPRAVFDTRLAAGFAGRSAEQSLQALLQNVLGVELPKGHARSDWLRRPLTPVLVAYALDDVIHLHRLRETLLGEAAARGNADRLTEDLRSLDAPGLYTDPKPRRQYERLKGASRLDTEGLQVLREVAAWRESRARRADRPRRWILPDNALTELAARRPDSPAALARCRSVPDRVRRQAGAALLACIRRGLAVPSARRPPPPPPARPEPADGPRVEAVQKVMQEQARALGIDPYLVASRAELARWLTASPTTRDGRLSRGWRQALMAPIDRIDDPGRSHQSGNVPPPAKSGAPA